MSAKKRRAMGKITIDDQIEALTDIQQDEFLTHEYHIAILESLKRYKKAQEKLTEGDGFMKAWKALLILKGEDN